MSFGLLVFCVAASAMSGCQSDNLRASGSSSGSSALAERSKLAEPASEAAEFVSFWSGKGDWDDIDASLGIGLERSELAVLEEQSSPTKRTFELISITGTKGRLIAAQSPDGKDTLISIEVRMTRSARGSLEQQQARILAKEMGRRLADLQGVRIAPVR